MRFFTFVAAVVFGCLSHLNAAPKAGIAMHGTAKYKIGDHFDYVNPDAPKGGTIKLGVLGAFDTLNPFTITGKCAAGLKGSMSYVGLVFEPLMMRSEDEPFSLYGVIAETIDLNDERSEMTLTLRPQARWDNGDPITADDVIFSFETFRDRGAPNQRLTYKRVKSVVKHNQRSMTFTFNKVVDSDLYDSELPLIVATMKIIPQHVYQGKSFESVREKDVLGSGVYRIKQVNMGRSITFERKADYWGKDISFMQGLHNFDVVKFDYYRNQNVLQEAFQSGTFDVKRELDALKWEREYKDSQNNKPGYKKIEQPHAFQVGFSTMVFNTRKDFFKDLAVRQALNLSFDFESMNKTYFNNKYMRTRSVFQNTELASSGAASPEERAILGEHIHELPAHALTSQINPPTTDKKGLRANLAQAKALLEGAGWKITNGQCQNVKTGQPFHFTFLMNHAEDQRVALAFKQNLKRLGIQMDIRVVDAAQHQLRKQTYDFDMMYNTWRHSLSPGREQVFYWSSQAADMTGTRNYAGIKNKAVDYLCGVVATASSRKKLVATSKMLDRAILAGSYVIPLFFNNKLMVAHWDKFGYPELKANHPISFETWWINKKKVQKVA